LVEYLKLVFTKNPLACIIRDDPFSNPSEGYITSNAPILADGNGNGSLSSNPFTQTYIADWSKVLELPCAITREHECWSYVSPL